MDIERIIKEKREIREYVKKQVKKFCDNNNFIDTLCYKNPAKIKKITSESVVVTPSKGRGGKPPITRTIEWSVIEGVYKELRQKKKIEMGDARTYTEMSTSYAVAFVGNFDDVENCSTKNKVILRLKEL